jgi:RNase H-fold protein (predicted Holliday junction resolvase)
VVLWDERLTTMQAERTRRERGVKGRVGIDAEAAAILLQSYVDARRGGSGWTDEDL